MAFLKLPMSFNGDWTTDLAFTNPWDTAASTCTLV